MAENPKTKPEQDDPEQSRRFMETAKQLGATEDGSMFEEVFSSIATSTVTPAPVSITKPAKSQKK